VVNQHQYDKETDTTMCDNITIGQHHYLLHYTVTPNALGRNSVGRSLTPIIDPQKAQTNQAQP
jgi:hypothetical protein